MDLASPRTRRSFFAQGRLPSNRSGVHFTSEETRSCLLLVSSLLLLAIGAPLTGFGGHEFAQCLTCFRTAERASPSLLALCESSSAALTIPVECNSKCRSQRLAYLSGARSDAHKAFCLAPSRAALPLLVVGSVLLLVGFATLTYQCCFRPDDAVRSVITDSLRRSFGRSHLDSVATVVSLSQPQTQQSPRHLVRS